jgi:thymidine kinase
MTSNNKPKLDRAKLEIFCGPMYSGKTEALLRSLERLYHAKINFLLFKMNRDKRYSEDQVVSHSKMKMKAINVETPLDIWKHCQENPDVKHIAIDEIQFLPTHDSDTLEPLAFDVVKLCKELKMQGYHIIASGLDMDFKGDPYGKMPQLLAIADKVEKLKAVCFKCGADAGFSTRLTDNQAVEDIGEKDKYEARCYEHWVEKFLESKNKQKK